MRDSTRLSALEQNPLWDFAVDFYARSGVSSRLLRLQDDAGLDVCVLLWRLWLKRHGLAPTELAEHQLDDVLAWQRDYTVPLRCRRRRLKPAAPQDAALAQLRRTLKEAELQAEKIALQRLEALSWQAGGVTRIDADEPAHSVLAGGRANGLPAWQQRSLAELVARSESMLR
ncbi:TIGR02444 family protein [Vreelandella jeotgali]|uniref:TIGR02444 family protein n=1 Tax=Vreelandella jeotgali TaxID=553386 RepID=UPI0003479207|nr:TIGR02444 family protein [Halomonas jeotgali]